MAPDTIWLTYAELAARRGISIDSARTLARRRRWPRQMGNDGQARIGVPAALVSAPDVSKDVPAVIPPDVSTDIPPTSQELVELRSRLALAEEEVARLRGRASDADRLDGLVEGLRAVEAELRARLDDAAVDRDRWAEMARRPWWKRLAG